MNGKDQPIAAPIAETPDAQTDAQLLERIGQRRCQASFAELYRRYQHTAYSLAYSLTNDPGSAEEAAQNGLLRVWLSAATFHQENARGWILCVIAREGLKQIKKQRREQHKIMASARNQTACMEPAAADKAEQTEVLSALRNTVAGLPALERQLLTLYFGAGLSQEEISRELDMPQQTISRRIQDVLSGLRGNLARAGFAAALPLVCAEKLGQITSSGLNAPAGLQHKIMLKLTSGHASASLKALARPAARAGRLAWGAGGAVAVAAVAAGVLWFGAGKPPAQSTPAAVVTVPAPAAVPPWQPLQDDFHEVFGQGQGAWTPQKTPQGLTLVFAPTDGKDSKQPSFCYVGHNFKSAYEMKGVFEYTGSTARPDDLFGAMLLVCHPNRFNCTGYVCGFKTSVSPVRFRMQVRFESNGCSFAIALLDAAGERVQSKPNNDWIQPPWHAENLTPWKQMSFANMKECGFGFEVRGPVKFSQLQVRPLVDSEWQQPVEEQSTK